MTNTGKAGTFALEYVDNVYLDPSFIEPARRTIRRLAVDEEEAQNVMDMLGI